MFPRDKYSLLWFCGNTYVCLASLVKAVSKKVLKILGTVIYEDHVTYYRQTQDYGCIKQVSRNEAV